MHFRSPAPPRPRVLIQPLISLCLLLVTGCVEETRRAFADELSEEPGAERTVQMFDRFCYAPIPDMAAIIEVADAHFTPVTGPELETYAPANANASVLKAWKFDDFDLEYTIGVSVAAMDEEAKKVFEGYETAYSCALFLPERDPADSVAEQVQSLMGREPDLVHERGDFQVRSWMGEAPEMRVHVEHYAPVSGGAESILYALVMTPPAPANPPVAAAANPLAAPDPFEGSFVGEKLSAEIRKAGEAYAGSLKVDGESYAFEARASGSSLSGEFRAGEEPFAFDAELKDDGDTLQLSTGGAEYTLARADAAGSSSAPNPLAKPSTPEQATKPEKTKRPALFGGGKKEEKGVADGGDSVLAQGSAASLSRDAAAAYVEALHFSLYQVNENAMVAELPQETVFAALAKEFPSFDSETQRELSNARAIWTETLAGWDSSSPEDQLEFVTEILNLAGFDTSGLSAAQPGAYGATAADGGSNSDSSYAGDPSYNQSAKEMERQSYLDSGATETGDGTYQIYEPSTGSYTYE